MKNLLVSKLTLKNPKLFSRLQRYRVFLHTEFPNPINSNKFLKIVYKNVYNIVFTYKYSLTERNTHSYKYSLSKSPLFTKLYHWKDLIAIVMFLTVGDNLLSTTPHATHRNPANNFTCANKLYPESQQFRHS